jgi:hypothetical protein
VVFVRDTANRSAEDQRQFSGRGGLQPAHEYRESPVERH